GRPAAPLQGPRPGEGEPAGRAPERAHEHVDALLLREAADVQERAVVAAVPVDLDAEDREVDRVRRDDDAVAPDAERLDVLTRRAARHEEGGRRRDRAPLQPLEQRVPASLVARGALDPEHDGTAAASGPAQARPERGLVPAAEADHAGAQPLD